METLVGNVGGPVRREKRNGRDYLVAPLTLIVPGVLNGSQGPLLYPQEELAKNVDAWNGIRLVVAHPRDKEGKAVSARSPDVLDSQAVGEVFNTKANGKLTAEGWFDVEATKRVDSRIMQALECNHSIELSTGLFTQNDVAPPGAVDNGKPYSYIARNYRPDHLAILLDEKGACSVEDGCGVNVNVVSIPKGDKWPVGTLIPKKSTKYSVTTDNAATKSEGGRPFPARDFAYVPDRNKPSTWKLRLTNVPGGSPDARIVGAAVAALGKGFRGSRVEIPPDALAAVKSKVRTAWLEANPGKSKDTVPRILNNKENIVEDNKRLEIINDLIANACCWEEADRETLNSFTDAKLLAMDEYAEQQEQKEVVLNAAVEGFTDKGGNEHTYNQEKREWETTMKKTEKIPEKELVANKELTEEEWMAKAPAGVRENLEFAENEKRKQKAAVVEQLTANIKDEQAQARMSEKFMGKSLEDLQDMASILPEQKPVANYTGASTPQPTNNAPRNFAPFGTPDEYLSEDS